MQTPEIFIKTIQDNYKGSNGLQPWLDPSLSKHQRKNGYTQGKVLREGRSGNTVRRPGLSDVGISRCQRDIAYALYGVSRFKQSGDEVKASNAFRGEMLNESIDTMFRNLKEDGTGIISGSNPGLPYFNKKMGKTMTSPIGRLFLEIEPFRNQEGAKVDYLMGAFDFISVKKDHSELIELKVVPGGLPVSPDKRYLNQLAIYLRANKFQQRGGWLIYIEPDISNLDHENPGTYRSFYLSSEQAQEMLYGEVKENLDIARGTIGLINRASAHDFYRTLDMFIGFCSDSDECKSCEKEKQFRRDHIINDDWTYCKK